MTISLTDPFTMPTTPEDLELRIRSFKRAISKVNAAWFALMGTLFLPLLLGLYLLRQGSSTVPRIVPYAWLCVFLMFVSAFVWDRHVKVLQRRHGLLCPNCGRVISRTGWRVVLSTGKCERCGSDL